MNKKFIVLIVLILLLLAGGVFWWWQSGEKTKEEIKKETILTPELEKKMDVFVEAIENREIEDQKILPEGLQVIREDNKKIVKDEAEGFRMEVPLNFILKEGFDTGHFSLYRTDAYKEFVNGEWLPTEVEKIYVSVEKYTEKLSLKDYVEKDGYYKEIEEIILGGEKAYKAKSFPSRGVDHISYFILKNSKIYYISIPFERNYNIHKEYEEIIYTLEFLE